MKLIPKAHEPKGRTAPITLDIFLSVQAKMPEHARPCVWTLLLTGARTGEYLRLRPDHLNHDLCAVAIPGTKTAGSRSTVFVAESHWPWIVLGVPSPIQYRWLYRHWKAAARECGHPSLTLHDIRSLHAIVALEQGAPVQDVQASMRHATAAMTLHYARQRGKGQVASAIGDALTDAGAAVVLPFPTPEAGARTGERGATLPATTPIAPEVASAREEPVVTPTAARPGRPKGKRYPKDDAGIARRQQRRMEGHRERPGEYLAGRSTVSSTGAKPAPKQQSNRAG